jgi:hypothetical protein
MMIANRTGQLGTRLAASGRHRSVLLLTGVKSRRRVLERNDGTKNLPILERE